MPESPGSPRPQGAPSSAGPVWRPAAGGAGAAASGAERRAGLRARRGGHWAPRVPGEENAGSGVVHGGGHQLPGGADPPAASSSTRRPPPPIPWAALHAPHRAGVGVVRGRGEHGRGRVPGSSAPGHGGRVCGAADRAGLPGAYGSHGGGPAGGRVVPLVNSTVPEQQVRESFSRSS
ncbi:hypothetical protein QJS66_00345 [Kocuria rhizophila]|nr:hypothetical protein QJS66_00345 [Kocuria rhizophila]